MTTSPEERLEELEGRYDADAMATGQRLQGDHFLRTVHELDEVDPAWAARWMEWIYGFLYNRGVLDDKTRSLVVLGECTVLKHTNQLENHMRTALANGATPDEVLEVLLQAAIYCGMPPALSAVRVFRSTMKDLGRSDYTDPPFVPFRTSTPH